MSLSMTLCNLRGIRQFQIRLFQLCRYVDVGNFKERLEEGSSKGSIVCFYKVTNYIRVQRSNLGSDLVQPIVADYLFGQEHSRRNDAFCLVRPTSLGIRSAFFISAVTSLVGSMG
jgi:hypothetical protein